MPGGDELNPTHFALSRARVAGAMARGCCASAGQARSASRAVRRAPSSSRRGLLRVGWLGAGGGALLAAAPPPSLAAGSFLDALKEGRKKSNASYLLSPLGLSRRRLADAKAALEGGAPAADVKRLVAKASLDCVAPTTTALGAYSNFRDVCTFRIVYTSVTSGPAARNPPGEPVGDEAGEALRGLVASFDALDAAVGASEPVDAAFDAASAALSRFEAAVIACLGLSDDYLEELRAQVSGA